MAQNSFNMDINLLFKASVESAKKNIESLGQLLDNISRNTTIGVNAGSVHEAVQAAQQLQIHLDRATNVDTGKLDLGKLSTSLKASNTSLSSLTNSLLGAGAQGQQAFVKIANAVASAEMPTRRMNATLKELGTTFANTAKWQISSMGIHAITGAIEGAIGYAKDLNRALNDIRIVTGKTTEQMASFANVAADAARRLNTTTTAYSEAALIFFQQGLEGDAVTERADTVIKLANVTGESAQLVSDQMTAIWNNFYDGSKSLEYYADALTRLGADTAASTDEITEGMEKFAAVAKTVGLSYEYAAAATATVVAETRQSADVVGTAFKTIFARMEGLSLGETLDDGTTLNKYSEALKSVGVSIKDSNGELKDMDTILDELGSRWNMLSKDTQVALAQSVGGLRQYNQFIALMDNWDKVKVNVDVAFDAEGSLNEQQRIWEESWEGASKRVQQRKNEIFTQILNDESVVGITNSLADMIEVIGNVIDSMGGIGPMLLMIAGIFSKTLFPMIGTGIERLVYNFRVFTGAAAQDVTKMKAQMQTDMDAMMANGTISSAMREQIQLSSELMKIKDKAAAVTNKLTEAQRLSVETDLAVCESLQAEAQERLKVQKAAEDELAAKKKAAAVEIGGRVGMVNANLQSKQDELSKQGKNLTSEQMAAYRKKEMKKAMDQQDEYAITTVNTKDVVQTMQDTTNDPAATAQAANMLKDTAGVELGKEVGASYSNYEKLNKAVVKLQADSEKYNKTAQEAKKIQEQLGKGMSNSSKEFDKAKKTYIEIQKAINKQTMSEKEAIAANEKLDSSMDNISVEDLSKKLGEASQKMKDLAMNADTAAYGANTLQEEMRESMVAAGISEQSLDGIATAARDAAQAEVDAANAVDNANNKIKETGDKLEGTGNKFANVTSTVTQVIGSITTAVAGIKMITSAFTDESMSGMERFMAMLSGLAMILPVVTMLFKKEAGEQGKSIAVKIADSLATGVHNVLLKMSGKALDDNTKDIAENTVAEGVNTATTWANVTAKLAALAVTNTGKAVIALATIAIIAGTVALISNTFATEENTEAIKAENAAMAEEGEKRKELTTAIIDENNALRDLTKQYEELKEAGKDTVSVEEQIRQQIENNAEAYRNAAKELYDYGDKLTDVMTKVSALEAYAKEGNIDMVNQLTAEISSQLAGDLAAESAGDATALYDKIMHDKSADKAFSDTGFLEREKGSNIVTFDSSKGDKSEKALQEAIENYNKKYGTSLSSSGNLEELQKTLFGAIKERTGADITFTGNNKMKIDMGENAAEYVAQVEALQDSMKILNQIGFDSDNAWGKQQLQSLIDAMVTGAGENAGLAELRTQVQTVLEANAEKAILDNPFDSSQETYEQYQKRLMSEIEAKTGYSTDDAAIKTMMEEALKNALKN